MYRKRYDENTAAAIANFARAGINRRTPAVGSVSSRLGPVFIRRRPYSHTASRQRWSRLLQ